MISFRLEEAGEAPHIYDLVHKTFGQDAEAVLVEDLCKSGDALVSIVAMDDDELVGHAMFSDTPINTSKGLLRGAALAPLSVSGLRQGQGIGGGLVMQGIRECRRNGIQALVVLGDQRNITAASVSAPTWCPVWTAPTRARILWAWNWSRVCWPVKPGGYCIRMPSRSSTDIRCG